LDQRCCQFRSFALVHFPADDFPAEDVHDQIQVNKDETIRYRARKSDCDVCALKERCTPKEPQRKVTRSIYETSRDIARVLSQTQQYVISRKLRKKVEMSFAHLKRIHGLGRLRLRGPCGAHDEFILAATAQNLKKLAKLAPNPIRARAAV
jgi:hypothetical protein